MRWVIAISLAIVAIASMAAGSCLNFFVQSGEPVVVSQNSVAGVRVGVTNICDSADFNISVNSDFPASIEPNHFRLRERGTQELILSLSPGGTSPGIHEVKILSSNGEEKSIFVKVLKGGNPLVLHAPTSISFREGEKVSFWVVVENKGNTTLSNVVVMFERDGRKGFYDTPLSLQPGERKAVKLNLGDLKLGVYDFTVKAFTGDISTTRVVTVKEEPTYVPVSTIINLRETSDGYVVEYTITNNADKELKDVFVTIEDAPSDWEVISPPPFDLKPNESTSVELVLKHGDQPNANVTISVYSGLSLVYEEGLEINQARLHGITGLFLKGTALSWGLFFLLLAGVAYLIYLHREKLMRRLSSKA
ncbi:MAG: hypothetical protein J7L23_03760 [Candidatus Diapherotrites archaeon]|nr:hypothetical protein [Candidatus Diapherotrites archaeon]